MNSCLRKFSYRIDLGFIPFLISGAAVFLIAALSVSWQTVKAARAKPVDSLRYQ
jgi:putative ABC transport system permease protein